MEKNQIQLSDQTPIESLICEIRGKKVILDYQLAILYGVETKNLKRAVKANANRFPSDFMFELTKEEFDCLRCKNFTSNTRGGNRYMPYAFTQEGVAMLSGLLRSEAAVKANIYIMRAFVKMRTTFASMERLSMDIEHLKFQISELNHYLEDVLRDQNDINEETMIQLQLINESLAEMQSLKNLLTLSERKSVLRHNIMNNIYRGQKRYAGQ